MRLLQDEKRNAEFKQVAGILRLGADMLAGLAHLHSHNIVHRDLAARNVLLDDNSRAKLVDFGLSRRNAHERYLMKSNGFTPWLFEVSDGFRVLSS